MDKGEKVLVGFSKRIGENSGIESIREVHGNE
jgi:hypothetical protein